MKTREYQYDNIRFLLIALVVLGHLLEIAGEFPHKETLYIMIYSFHMPAFLFLSGMFARFDRIKWIFGMALPYLLLQWLYTAFVEKLGDPYVHVQFSRPYWILWYLFVLAIYTLLLPVYDALSPARRWLMVAVSVVLALLAGFDKSIDYQWSASRIIVFQPWFLLGYYFRRADGLRTRWNGAGRRSRGIMLSFAAACCVALEWLLLRQGVTAKMMLGAYGYEDLGYSWQVRGLIMCCAASVIFLLFAGLVSHLKHRIPVITVLGQNTLPIYLLHGFIVQMIRMKAPWMLAQTWQVLLAWMGLLLLLGNPVVGRCTNFLLGGGWYRLLQTRFTCGRSIAPGGKI
ncbi:MAG: acyltransferase family protein [Clostridiales bacterium]|uniref:acyltransferase family protein n=1 Tax=Flavonifractor porci TaxID=3133422 RepID=UPI0030AFD42A|nr:acyltransferase family protein [Clostridiales bacterium]